MLSIKILQWIEKALGGLDNRDSVSFEEKVTVVDRGKIGKVKVTEISVSIRKEISEKGLVKQSNYKLWQKELIAITGNSLSAFHCESKKSFASSQNKTETGEMLTIRFAIHHAQEV